jgi:spore coat protein U-like protein
MNNILERSRKRFVVLVMLIIISFISPTPSFAAEDGTINCTITCSNIVFTSFNPYDSTPETSTGSIAVRCANTGTSTRTVEYFIGIIGGNSNNYSARVAKNGTNSLSYNIFKDAARTQIMGDTSNGTVYISSTMSIVRNGSRTDNYTIYGRVPVQPLARPMTYTDAIQCGVLYNY